MWHVRKKEKTTTLHAPQWCSFYLFCYLGAPRPAVEENITAVLSSRDPVVPRGIIFA